MSFSTLLAIRRAEILHGLAPNLQVLPWHDMVLLLEGQTLYLPMLKSHFAKDILFSGDALTFCTSKLELIFIRLGVLTRKPR